MEIVVAVKPVPEPEARLRATADGAGLDTDAVKFVLAGYDESAVEQALLLKEAHPPSSVEAISFGPAGRCEEVLRAALALGCDRATLIERPASTPLDDPMAVARALAATLRGKSFDLLLVGKQAGDDEEGVVGAAVAALLGVAYAGFVTDLRLDVASGELRFHRSSERGDELWRGRFPCVLALQQAWNDPRTAKLPAILKSRRTPIEKPPAPAEATGSARSAGVRFALPAPRSGARLIEYTTPEEAAQKLVKILREEAKVFP